MSIVDSAYHDLYGEPLTKYAHSLNYSRRLRDFNANVRIMGNKLVFSLSAKWRGVSEEIQIGLLQLLLSRVFKKPKKTIHIDLYHNFVKNLSLVTPSTKSDETLRQSFERVNEKYFYGTMDMPNLVFGKPTTRTLGSYNFHTNTIRVSPLLRHAESRLLDCIMYHELLHKKLQFKAKTTKTMYHTRGFRLREKEFEDAEQMEREIRRLLRRSTRFRLF